MRVSIGWKILFAFLFTFYFVIPSTWVAISAFSGRVPSEEVVADRVAPVLVAALARSLEQDGLAGYERDLRLVGKTDAGAFALTPVAEGKWRESAPEGPRSRIVRAPDGRVYRLAYEQRFVFRPRDVLSPANAVIAGLLAGIAFSLTMTWYITRPLRLFRAGFSRLAEGDLSVRLAARIGHRRDEVTELAQSFDQMAAQLEQLVETRDRMLHDVSHELRSPLARLQSAIDLARQDPQRVGTAFPRIEQEARRLEQMVSSLLVLARSESGAAQLDEYFDLNLVIEDIVADAQFEAEAKHVTICLEVSPGSREHQPPVRGSPELLRRAVENTLRNSLRFSPAGSSIAVRVELDRSTSCYLIQVRDHGPGLSDLTPAEIFEPFVSGGASGFGLGLAIARRSIEALDGTIAAATPPEGGLEISMTVPAQGSSSEPPR